MKCAWIVAAVNFFKAFLARLKKAISGPTPSISYTDSPSAWQGAEPGFSIPPARTSEAFSSMQQRRPHAAPRNVDPRQLLERISKTSSDSGPLSAPEIQKFFPEN
jgi:hypothetical protein